MCAISSSLTLQDGLGEDPEASTAQYVRFYNISAASCGVLCAWVGV